MDKGIIVSIQGYHYKTIAELAIEAINAGCVGLRIDKRIELPYGQKTPIIGIRKVKVNNIKDEPYITPDVATIEQVMPWADMIAVDYRTCNPNLQAVSDFAKEHKLKLIADIETWEDFENIKAKGYYYSFVATTLSVFDIKFRPDLKLLARLVEQEKNVIAEGNFNTRADVKEAFQIGARAVCIGSAITNIYKLTRKYTSLMEQVI